VLDQALSFAEGVVTLILRCGHCWVSQAAIKIQNLIFATKNDQESYEYHRESTSKIKRTYDHMGTWLAGVHLVARQNKAAPSKIPKKLHLKPTNEGKRPQQNAI
jgi:hypothetical protein